MNYEAINIDTEQKVGETFRPLHVGGLLTWHIVF